MGKWNKVMIYVVTLLLIGKLSCLKGAVSITGQFVNLQQWSPDDPPSFRCSCTLVYPAYVMGGGKWW